MWAKACTTRTCQVYLGHRLQKQLKNLMYQLQLASTHTSNTLGPGHVEPRMQKL
jgi:hypothetical protein